MKELKEWYHIYKNDLLAISLAGLGIFLLIYLYIKGPILLREKSMARYPHETVGYLIKVKPKETLHQWLTGNKYVIDGFDVYYTYEVNTVLYKGHEYITSRTLKPFQKNQLRHFKKELKVLIKYQEKHPERSMVVIEK